MTDEPEEDVIYLLVNTGRYTGREDQRCCFIPIVYL